MATKLNRRAPAGMGTSKCQAVVFTRITGLTAASLPSISTLNTTLGNWARLDPLLTSTRFSSAPAKATKRRNSGFRAYSTAHGACTPSPRV